MAGAKSLQPSQTLELVSWLKENSEAEGYAVTIAPPNSRLIVGRVKGTQISSLTLATPDGHAGMFNIQPIPTRQFRAGA